MIRIRVAQHRDEWKRTGEAFIQNWTVNDDDIQHIYVHMNFCGVVLYIHMCVYVVRVLGKKYVYKKTIWGLRLNCTNKLTNNILHWKYTKYKGFVHMDKYS